MSPPAVNAAVPSREDHVPDLVALYPGSFKPPNASHMHAIDHLLNEVRVSKVVVIISNRCRPIPDTDLAIDATSAVLLFENMLRVSALPLDRVELVVARHRAVTDAVARIGHVARNTSLLFCVGEEDYRSSDNRFSNIRSLAEENDASARVYVLPIASNNVHSSELRAQLARSDAGMHRYIEGLPENFSSRSKLELWSDCRARLRSVSDIVRSKIIAPLKDKYGISDAQLMQTSPATVDPNFELRAADGEMLLVKYAGDTTSTGVFGDRFIQKPARRVAVEKRATKYLASQLSPSIFPTRVDFYDRELRLLVLAGRPINAAAIASEISDGVFRKNIARNSGNILAKIHCCPVPDGGFWSDSTYDRDHWRKIMVALAEQARNVAKGTNLDSQRLDHLDAVASSARPQVLHMSFTPDNLWCGHESVTVENLECASNFGDPAYDVAALVSSYLMAGFQQASLDDCLAAIVEFETGYRDACVTNDHSFTGRVLIYAAYHMLAGAPPEWRAAQIGKSVSWAMDLIQLGQETLGAESQTTIAELLKTR